MAITANIYIYISMFDSFNVGRIDYAIVYDKNKNEFNKLSVQNNTVVKEKISKDEI